MSLQNTNLLIMVVDIALKTLAFPKSLAEYEMVKDLVGNISWYFQSHCIFRLHYTVWSLSGQIVYSMYVYYPISRQNPTADGHGE